MPESGPFLLGVTGNIACGKSLVTSMLADLGADVIDADHVAHDLMQPGSDVLRKIVAHFGAAILQPDGSLNRPALGSIVFGDPEALAQLERITHPPTVREILRRASASTASVVVIDAIKLFEAGLADHCHQTWTVSCNPAAQLDRLMERNRLTEQEARQRIESQPAQSEKIRKADVVIDNSGSTDETRAQVRTAWMSLPVS